MTTSQTIMFEKTQKTYDILKNGKIEITYIANEAFPEEVLVLEVFDMNFEVMFIFDELLFSTNNSFEEIFK